MHLEKFDLDQIHNGWLSAIIYFNIADIWQTELIPGMTSLPNPFHRPHWRPF